MQGDAVKSGKRQTISLFNIDPPRDLMLKLDIKYKEWAQNVPMGLRASKTAFYLNIFNEYTKDVQIPQAEN